VKLSIASAATAVMLFSLPALAQETYVIEPVHSQPQWVATHIGFSQQHGSFGKATGKIVLDRAAKRGSIDVSIDASSIRTHSERLDAIVKGEKFFNVEKFPTMTFKSTNLTFDGDALVGAEGELTMLGISKPVALKVANFKCGEQPFNKKPMCAAQATTTIKRSEWGMTEGIKFTNPGDDIQLIIPVEAYRDMS
jgi:polyisoprenoid-binding protein YceI